MYSKQKSLNFGNYVPNDKVLNKKVPENPKYKHVKPAIDTGKNIRKHIDELKEKQKTCSHKKDEVFKRIKTVSFIKLAIAVAEEALESTNNENDTGNSSNNTDVPKTSESSGRRCAANVLMGIGELDVLHERKTSHPVSTQVNCSFPYLLLDVRDRDAFSKCHIKTAKHYPSTMLSRSVNYETEDMKLFKNVQNKLIVVYDDDESIATRVATTLVERGYENIHLLIGGLKLALEICPKGLTTCSHTLPVNVLSQNANSQAQRAGKEYFSQEDICTIEQYLDIYPKRADNTVWNSNYSQSQKSKSKSSHSHLNCVPSSSCASTISGRSSTFNSSTVDQRQQLSTSSRTTRTSHTLCSSTKNMERTRFKPPIEDKMKLPKRAPWK